MKKMINSFSLKTYDNLLKTALDNKYHIIKYNEYLKNKDKFEKVIILKHDIDKRPYYALSKAEIEKDLHVTASYYFRIKAKSFNEKVIKAISKLGHEIGYHYEELTSSKGDYELAIKMFKANIEKFRQIYPVETICMHGSPLSKWDNSLLWNRFDYRNFGILADPMLDINFNIFFYLTDTGMKWNAFNVSIRDKVKTKTDYIYNSTFDLIKAIQEGKFPHKVLINTHPQRWSDSAFNRLHEYGLQVLKNFIKKQIIRMQNQ